MKSALRRAVEVTLIIVLSLGVLSPATAAPPSQGPGIIYTVQPGDCLSLIADRYGVDVETLVRVNNIRNPDVIIPGQHLLIPRQEVPLLAEGKAIVEPYPLVQGEAGIVLVRQCDGDLPSGEFAGQKLRFIRSPRGCIAFLGVYALAKPGTYPLQIRLPDGARLSIPVPVVAGDYEVEHIHLSPAKRALLKPELILQERDLVSKAFGRFTPEAQWYAPFSLPLRGKIHVTSPFGFRRSYNNAPPRGFHSGVDLRAKEGDPVYAPAPGQVVLAQELTIRGNAVILNHGAGVMSGFWHLSGIAVREGEEVGRGDLLGWVGSTGLSTGPHLHWEVRVNGVAVNPLTWTRRGFWYEVGRTRPRHIRLRGYCEEAF
ncbi:MAG: hypothetical protein DRI61_01840 [Chloroflexi bacterium]|nr:MAG: hypothetical protein DRI61_01840 [Chloroflexota bacterium]